MGGNETFRLFEILIHLGDPELRYVLTPNICLKIKRKLSKSLYNVGKSLRSSIRDNTAALLALASLLVRRVLGYVGEASLSARQHPRIVQRALIITLGLGPEETVLLMEGLLIKFQGVLVLQKPQEVRRASALILHLSSVIE